MNTIEQEIHSFKSLRNQIFEYFGYKEDWCVFPLVFSLYDWWYLDLLMRNQTEMGEVTFWTDEDRNNGEWYTHIIYHNRFLPKAVYEGIEFTMILVDTQVDGNRFLQVFRNSNRVNEFPKEFQL